MSSRIEILDGGYRSDGRRQYELRDIIIDLTPQGTADGAATISHGLTQVQVQVFGPREAKMRSQTMHDRANINVELAIAPFSSGNQRRRGRSDKRILEMATTIKQTFEPVVQTSLYPRSQIDIFILVLQQDGGVLPACINATTLALASAGIPLLDFVCAITGGAHAADPLLDLTALEEADVPHATVAVMPRTGRATLVTLETRLHVDRFEEVVRIAGEAGQVVHREMRQRLRERTKALVEAMAAGGGGRSGGEVREREVYDDRMDEM